MSTSVIVCSVVGVVLVLIAVIVIIVLLWLRRRRKCREQSVEQSTAAIHGKNEGTLNGGYEIEHPYYINDSQDAMEKSHIPKGFCASRFYVTDELYSEAEDRRNTVLFPESLATHTDLDNNDYYIGEVMNNTPEKNVEPQYAVLEEPTEGHSLDDTPEYVTLQPEVTDEDHHYNVLEDPNEIKDEASLYIALEERVTEHSPETPPEYVTLEPDVTDEDHHYNVLEDPNEIKDEAPLYIVLEKPDAEDHRYNVREGPNELHEYGVLHGSTGYHLYGTLQRTQQIMDNKNTQETLIYYVPERLSQENIPLPQSVLNSEAEQYSYDNSDFTPEDDSVYHALEAIGSGRDNNDNELRDCRVVGRVDDCASDYYPKDDTTVAQQHPGIENIGFEDCEPLNADRQPVYEVLEESTDKRYNENEENPTIDDQPIYGNVEQCNCDEESIYGNVSADVMGTVANQEPDSPPSGTFDGSLVQEEENIFADISDILTQEERKRYRAMWRQS